MNLFFSESLTSLLERKKYCPQDQRCEISAGEKMSTASEEAVKQLRTFMEDGVCVCVFLHVFKSFFASLFQDHRLNHQSFSFLSCVVVI